MTTPRPAGQTKARILALVRQGQTCTGRLMASLGLSRVAVNFHLKGLVQDGRLMRTGAGPSTRYRVASPGIDHLSRIMAWFGANPGIHRTCEIADATGLHRNATRHALYYLRDNGYIRSVVIDRSTQWRRVMREAA